MRSGRAGLYLRGSPQPPTSVIPQLLDHAADAYYGPPLLNGQRLPFPSYPDGQVNVKWVAEHATRTFGSGLREVIGETEYRPTFEFSYDYLEAVVEEGIWQELRTPGPLTFAPYSLGGQPHPQAYSVLPPDEIPDTADLLLARYPFGLTLVGRDTWALADIPTTLPQNPTYQHPPVANVAAGMRVLPIGISFDPAGMAVGEPADPCPGGPSSSIPSSTAESESAGMAVESSPESGGPVYAPSESQGLSVQAPPPEPPPPTADPAGMSVGS